MIKSYNSKKITIDIETAELYFERDLKKCEEAVRRLINVYLNSNQFSALCSFVFNLGSGNLQASTLRRKLNEGNYDEVPNQLLRWKFANGKMLKGLLKRREDEARLFTA